MFKQNIEELNKHREQTIKDIQTLLVDNKRVACIRYTGYGKSYYIIRKLIDKIDGQVIIVVPNDTLKIYYEEQYSKNKNVIILTYQIIKNKTTDFIQQNYNNVKLIIADECHHITADKWTKEFQRLESITNSKVLGLTATPEKIKDISVVDEFFNGIQVEPMNLLDGISLGFVPKIKYIVAYTSLDDRIQLITKKLTEIDRYRITNLLKVENIFKSHITPDYLEDNLKILVFVSRISFISEAKYKIHNWFKSIYPNKVINIYSISSNQAKSKNDKALENFKFKHKNNTIDIMISVDKLIEGLHLPEVSIEIALRKTQSTRIYFQQIGRVINSKQPIVFDLINNASHLYQIKKEYEINKHYILDIINSNREKVMFDNCVELIDETKEIEDILRSYNKDAETIIEEIITNNLDFIKENNGKLIKSEIFSKLGIKSDYYYRIFKDICKTKFNIDFKSKFFGVQDEFIDKWELYKDEIITNIEGLSKKGIAKKYGFVNRTFYNFIKDNNIEINNLPIKPIRQDIIDNLDYIKENPDSLNMRQMAKKLNVKYGSFISCIKDMNITVQKLDNSYVRYQKAKMKVDKDIDNIKKQIENGVSINKLSKVYNISAPALTKHLKEEYNITTTKNIYTLDLDYIKENPDNLDLLELAKKFGYKESGAFKNRLIRNNIKQIPYKDGFIEISYSVSSKLLQKIIDNKDYIIKNKDILSIEELSRIIDVNKSVLSHVLHELDIDVSNKSKSNLYKFIYKHIDFIKSNYKDYTISGMATKLLTFEDGKEFSRTGLSAELKKLNLKFKKK